jgi:IS1 family transposase
MDLWKVYQNVIPPKSYRPQQERGQTNHVERFNGTIGQFYSRLVRQNNTLILVATSILLLNTVTRKYLFDHVKCSTPFFYHIIFL